MPAHFLLSCTKHQDKIELTYEIVMIMMSLLTLMVSRFWQTDSYSASGFILLSILRMRKNLLVPLCGRTGGGRVRACWFCMSSLSTPFRSATIINWQWFGRTSYTYRSRSWFNLLCFIPLHFLHLFGISLRFTYRTLSLCPDWFKAFINYCIHFGQWCFVLDKNHGAYCTAYSDCPYCAQ